MEFLPIKTRVVRPPKDDISDVIDSLDVRDGDIIFITSKVLGIAEGRTARADKIKKEELISREAERFLPYVNKAGDFHVNLTVVQNVLMLGAGIDESNANGYYVMWPKEPDENCRKIRERLMRLHPEIKKLGVIATDSHTTPLRWGVTGITIGLAGVEPLRDIRGEPDLFGRPMRVTKVNLIDPLASMAVLLMGENDECTPIVILRGYEGIPFADEASMKDFKIRPEEDLYQALIDVIPKK